MLTQGIYQRQPTTVENLVNRERREVSVAVLSDPEVYALEMQKLFSRTWLLLAHETEIPNPGDFVVRDMGDDQVVIVRDRNRKIHVHLNVCAHRAMRVAMAEAGNIAAFHCIYHGWTYRHDGSFIAAPIPGERMHGDICEKSELGLRSARCTLYGGFVFATWNHTGPSLEEFLGDYKFYTDAMFLRSDAGLEVLGPPQRALVQANWKCAAEQFAGDGFHGLTLHRSMMELGRTGGSDDKADSVAPGMYAANVGTRQGHGMRCISPYSIFTGLMGQKPLADPMEQLSRLPPAGMSPEMVPQVRKHLSDGQLRLLATTPPAAGGLFPNIGFSWFYTPRPDGTLQGRMALHAFVPRGPDRFEFMNWVLAEKDAPESFKEEILISATTNLGTTGVIEQDDSETWPHMQRSSRGPVGRQQTLKYQALLGENKPPDWPGGGLVYSGFGKDDTQWNWWQAWHDAVSVP